MTKFLIKAGWIEKDLGNDKFTLTLEGWKIVNNLRKCHSKSTQVFVAMWFHEKMNSIYDNGFEPAIRDAGYSPMVIRKHIHENRIDDEIEVQIRKSRLLVVDVTGDRSGVYYEAGFAKGLGIPVIWCCNQSWKVRLQKNIGPDSMEVESDTTNWTSMMHFDTRQYTHILWKDEQDLRDQLSIRIQSMLPSNEVNS
jgi:nucleoside 2-deoxyribosyltransferase